MLIKQLLKNLIKYMLKSRKGHDRRYGIDPTKIKEELGWYPETTFEVKNYENYSMVFR